MQTSRDDSSPRRNVGYPTSLHESGFNVTAKGGEGEGPDPDQQVHDPPLHSRSFFTLPTLTSLPCHFLSPTQKKQKTQLRGLLEGQSPPLDWPSILRRREGTVSVSRPRLHRCFRGRCCGGRRQELVVLAQVVLLSLARKRRTVGVNPRSLRASSEKQPTTEAGANNNTGAVEGCVKRECLTRRNLQTIGEEISKLKGQGCEQRIGCHGFRFNLTGKRMPIADRGQLTARHSLRFLYPRDKTIYSILVTVETAGIAAIHVVALSNCFRCCWVTSSRSFPYFAGASVCCTRPRHPPNETPSCCPPASRQHPTQPSALCAHESTSNLCGLSSR